MYDNGLLHLYRQHDCQDGFLDVSILGLVKTKRSVCKVTRCLTNYGPFYLKVNGYFGTINKNGTDAEILLGQLYNKAGIRSAIYLPAQENGNKVLLSNDVERENKIIPACSYIDAHKPVVTAHRDFLNPKHKYKDLKKIYTPKAMKEQTIMRILDTACYHTDRHYANFFYELERRDKTLKYKEYSEEEVSPRYDNRTYPEMVSPIDPRFMHKPSLFKEIVSAIKDRTNRADGVVAIDFESSGYNAHNNMHPAPGRDFYDYITDFDKPLMRRQDVLEEIRTNEMLADLIDKPALAETIGSLNPQGVAQEIYDVTGYQVNPEYTNYLTHSLDQMAETLIK